MRCQGESQLPARSLILTLLILLAACSPGPAAGSTAALGATGSPTVAPSPTAPPAATASPTAAPSPTALPSPTAAPGPTPTPPQARFGYPIGLSGRAPGDGFFIRHGYAAENTWYNPGHWHTGEDWYAVAGDTAGAEVYAIAAGAVVYVGSNYPGRVVVVEHAADLFSMYGHLDPAVAVAEGQAVERGDLLGAVLRRGDDVPNHLHFEVRTFLTAGPVNGPSPRYGFRCGPRCPPGPGYWPIRAPDHPSDLGWRNPAHVIAGRMFPVGAGPLGEVVVVAAPPRERVTLWTQPPAPGARQEAAGELVLTPGARLPLLAVWAGAEDTRETSAQAYQLWYQVALPQGRAGWAPAALPSPFELGGDGRPSSVELVLLPAP